MEVEEFVPNIVHVEHRPVSNTVLVSQYSDKTQ
jgi:hypothetical protein